MILTLTQTWINLMTTGEAVVAYSGRGRSRQASQEGEVRRYAGGRFRSVTTVGTRRSLTFTLRDVTQAQLDTLESWIGQTVVVRDTRGRRMFGVYYSVPYTDRSSPTYYDITLEVTEVTHSEDV